MNESYDTDSTHVYTVSGLNAAVNHLLKDRVGMVRITGEISGYKKYPSGHSYFSLKDESAEVRCALFRGRARFVQCELEDGMQVEATASVELYEARGQFQLIVSTLSPIGEGVLLQQIEALKKRLRAKGLFDAAHKKPLPTMPNVIGVLTSTGGAVLHDITRTLRARYPLAEVVVYPVAVQGEDAVKSICDMLALANRRAEADVLILARGGGSIQDLIAFSSEEVAYAIFESALPIVAGIGHEPDHSIADDVADRSEATPTAAAQAATPMDMRALQHALNERANVLIAATRDALNERNSALHRLRDLVAARSPGARIQNAMQRLDDRLEQVGALMRGKLSRRRQSLLERTTALHYLSPSHRIQREREQLVALQKTLRAAMVRAADARRQRLRHLREQMTLLNPSDILQRGYAIVSDAQERVLTSAKLIRARDDLTIRLRDGRLETTVKKVIPNPPLEK